MTRRLHKRLSLNRRQQFGPVLPSNFGSSNTPSNSPGSTSSSGSTTQSDPTTGNPDPATGSANTNSGGGSGNNAGGSNSLPNGAPKDSNPSPSSSNPAPAAASSNDVPSVDPAPPKGAAQQTSSPSSPSSSPVLSASVVPPGSSTGSSGSSIAGASPTISSSSSVAVSTPASSAAVMQTPAVLPSSSSPVFNTLNTPAASVTHQPTITGLPTPSSTSSAASSSGISTAAIVGIAAGGLCGLAILGAFLLWIGKRVSRYMETKDLEPPPMHDLIPDDDSTSVLSRRPSGPSSTPRPPTMIERKQANFAGRGNGFYNNGFAPQPGFSQYADPRFGNATPSVPPFGPPPGQYYPNQAVNAPPVQPYFNPIATPSPFDDSAAASMPGTPVYFSRQNSMQSGFTNPPNEDSQPPLPNPYDTPIARPNDGYATLNRGPGSVSPQQARQYSDLARQLDFSSPSDRGGSPSPSATGSYAPLMYNNAGVPASPKSPSFKAIPRSPSVVNVPTEIHAGRATPVQFGFNDPSSATVPAQATAQPTNAHPSAQPARPETMYDEEDAYAAI